MGGKFVHPPLINLILGMFTRREEDPITHESNLPV